jgi:hypothetical protein
MTTKQATELEFITLQQVSATQRELEKVEALIQQAKDSISRHGYGGMFSQDELDAWMKHSAQLFRLHETGRRRLSNLAFKLRRCIHCGETLENYHGRFARCQGGKTQFEAPKIRHDAWKDV